MSHPLKLFALQPTLAFGKEVAKAINLPLSPLEERDFEDGEHKTRPLESVRECDVYVIHSPHSDGGGSVNDKLCRLLFFIGALRDSGAFRVTAVVPYLCYARKDRKTKHRDPVTTRYVAALFEAVGTDRLVTIDVHNLQAYQNAFRRPTENLEAHELFADYFAAKYPAARLLVMSPDLGGFKRAGHLRELLTEKTGTEVGFAFMEKHRSMDVLSGEVLAGDVKGRHVIIVDDLVSSGSTLVRAAKACRAQGAVQVDAAATHGVFSSKAREVLADKALGQLVITNTIPTQAFCKALPEGKAVVLNVAPLFAEIIQRMHTGQPGLLPVNEEANVYENR